MPLSNFTFAVPANTERVIAVTADWVYVVSATAKFELAVDHESTGEVEAGTLWHPRNTFRQIRLRNPQATINTIEIKCGDGTFEDRRGESGGAQGVDPVSQGDIRAYARRGQRSLDVPAGDFGAIQLWNPSGSGVIGAVRGLYLHASVGAEIVVFAHDTELASDFPSNTNVNPAYLGDPDGALEWHYETDTSLVTPSPAGKGHYVTVRVGPLGFVFLPFGSPVLIPEGWGLVARHQARGALNYDFGVDVLELPA